MDEKIRVDMEPVQKALAGLGEAIREVGRAVQVNVKRVEEMREVGALFELHRAHHASSGPEAWAEVGARRQAALEGYSTEFLADLLTFADWLNGETGARPVWDARKR